MNRFILRRLTWLDARAEEAENEGELESAYMLRRDHCALVSEHLGPGHPWWVEAMLRLAQCATATGRPEVSETALDQTLTALLEDENENDRDESSRQDLVRVLNALGVFYCRQGRPVEAVEPLSRALAESSDVLDPGDPRLAALHNNLGSALHSSAALYEAERHYRRALEIYRQGPETLDLAHCLTDLAELFDELDDPESDEHSREALALFRRLQIDDPAGLASSLTKLAGLATRRAKTGEAIALLEEAAELLRPLPSKVDQLAHCLHLLGHLEARRLRSPLS